MPTFFAQPYDLHADGFYFEDEATYREKLHSLVNRFGDPVEEFEIQFIDGEALDAELAKALQINQANIPNVMQAMEDWCDDQKRNVILAVSEAGYDFDPATDDPDRFDIDIYHYDSLKELAEHFVEEGYFGDIPEPLRFYIDHEAIARDLAMDYCETNIAGETIIYRIA